jgi:CubicO group peptidase (beta-lactamase class C family)
VRVNVLALAALHVMKTPLPEVLKAAIMDPIGASNTWHWEPYANAYVTIDGKKMPSVPGGGTPRRRHVHERLGHGAVRLPVPSQRTVDGEAADLDPSGSEWLERQAPARTLTARCYGFMNWFLNVPAPPDAVQPGRKMYPAAPDSAVCFRGNGENLIYVDWENDLVVVVRWINSPSGFFKLVLDSIKR